MMLAGKYVTILEIRYACGIEESVVNVGGF